MVVHLRELLAECTGTREETRSHLLRTIMAKPGNQAYLSNRSGLSQATVSALVGELQKSHWVTVTKAPRSSNVQVAPTTGAAVGIELGFRHTAVVARRVEQSYDSAEVVLARVGAAQGTGRWLPGVADAVREAVNELGENEIAAIGLAIPRMVDPKEGTLMPPALPPWTSGDDPAQMLFDELSRGNKKPVVVAPRVVLDNDANLAAVAESVYAWDDAEILIAVKASTGIGAGVVIGGRLFRGAQGAAGEIGHIVVKPDGAFCSCGGRGCLETVIGADALVENARMVLGHTRQPSPEELEDLVRMATAGNVSCQRVLAEAARTLGSALGNLCNVLNPSVVVLGGAFGREDAAKFTLEPCREALRQTAMQAAVLRDFVVPSRVQHAAAHGALIIALEGTFYSA
jgi:predicted NBD/HSP70 family sugar kinase